MKNKLTDRNVKAKRRIIVESLMALLIVISPFVFKLHEYVPENDSINLLGITIGSNGFPNVNVFIWFMLGKVVPFYLLLIWFFTCKHWWYHIIIIPVLMYAFQIFEGIEGDKFIDTENVLWLLPFCMIVIPFVYLIRIKLYDKYVHGIDLDAMDAELKALREKEAEREAKKNQKVERAIERETTL